MTSLREFFAAYFERSAGKAGSLSSARRRVRPLVMRPGLQPSRGRLLIVEDDDPTRFALAKILTIQGYEVATAATVEAALVKCEDHDCLLLDLHLPDGLGLEVLKRMRQKCRDARIAICSAAYDPALRDRVEEYQPDAVFIKPIDLDALLAWIARVCSKGEDATSGRQAGDEGASRGTHP